MFLATLASSTDPEEVAEKILAASLCADCTKAGNSCPIYEPGKFVDSCVEYYPCKPEPEPPDCEEAKCQFHIGQKVEYQGVIRTIYDIDLGYGGILALDGDKYISPGDPHNRCIEAPIGDCKKVEEPSNSHPSS